MTAKPAQAINIIQEKRTMIVKRCVGVEWSGSMFTKKASFWVIVRKRCGKQAYLTEILTRGPVETTTHRLGRGGYHRHLEVHRHEFKGNTCQPSIKADIGGTASRSGRRIDGIVPYTMISVNDGYLLDTHFFLTLHHLAALHRAHASDRYSVFALLQSSTPGPSLCQ